jgi:hypothetical protein
MKPFCYAVERENNFGCSGVIVEPYTRQNGVIVLGNIVYYEGIRIMRATDKEFRNFGESSLVVMAKALYEKWEAEYQRS